MQYADRRAIPGFEGFYEASAAGEIFRISPKKGAVLDRPLVGGMAGKYKTVILCNDSTRSSVRTARVICMAFHGSPPSPRHQVNHKNGITTDDRPENLEWVTPSENTRHRFDVLGKQNKRGDEHPESKLTTENVAAIRALLASGGSHKAIAAQFSVSRQTITAISTGRNWAHVPAGPVIV